jgi:hypothetical protein
MSLKYFGYFPNPNASVHSIVAYNLSSFRSLYVFSIKLLCLMMFGESSIPLLDRGQYVHVDRYQKK